MKRESKIVLTGFMALLALLIGLMSMFGANTWLMIVAYWLILGVKLAAEFLADAKKYEEDCRRALEEIEEPDDETKFVGVYEEYGDE